MSRHRLFAAEGARLTLIWCCSPAPQARGKSQDLVGAQVVVAGYVNGVPQTQLVLKEGAVGGQV